MAASCQKVVKSGDDDEERGKEGGVDEGYEGSDVANTHAIVDKGAMTTAELL